MITALLNVPSTENDWSTWSYHHRLSHDAIRAAVLAQKHVNLPDYQLDPIPTQYLQDWLERNQQAHVDMDGAIGSQSTDLSDLNPDNKNELSAWVYNHWLEHQTAERVLKIGS